MQRYFILDEKCWTKNHVKIKGDDFHHLTRVMRKDIKSRIICINKSKDVALCEIKSIEKNEVVLSIIEWLQENNELPIEITLAQGFPKKDKFEFVLQKSTELGVKEIVPYIAYRSIAKLDDQRFKKRVKRFEKIVKEASEQSNRQMIPHIEKPKDCKSLIEFSKDFDYVFFAYEETVRGKDCVNLSEVIGKLKKGMKILICIGPEGGFDPSEIDLFLTNDWIPIRLGKRILRTETAPMYILSVLSFYFEEYLSV